MWHSIRQWLSQIGERKWGPPFLLLVLTLLVFYDLLWLPPNQFVGGVPYGSQGNDITFQFLPWWRFAADVLAQNEFPLWNPFLSSGVPFIANPQPALFYPPIWLISILSPTRSIGILLVLHLWLAGWGMYTWLRVEGCSYLGSILGASVFAFSGYFFVRSCAGHIGVIMTQAWLPWILWSCRKAIEQRRWPWVILGGIPVGFSLLAGNPASFLYVGGTFVLYTLYTIWRNGDYTLLGFRAVLWPLLGIIVIGLGLAAIQLVPTLEFLVLSTRQQTSYAFSANFSWPPGYLVTLLIPNFFGDSVTTGYWGEANYYELIFYVGILPLILTLFPFVRSNKHDSSMGPYSLVPGLLALGIAGLLLAMGRFSIVHHLAYAIIPLFRVTRAPARAGFIFTLAVAALSGLIITQITRSSQKVLQSLKWGYGGWIAGSVTILVVLTSFTLFTLQRDSNPGIGRLWHIANGAALFLFFLLLSVALLEAWRKENITNIQGAILAIILVLVDLWSFGRPLLQPVTVTDNHFWTQVARLITQGNQQTITENHIGRVLPWGINIFEQNQGMHLGLKSVFSYDPLELQRYHRFTTYIEDPRARAYDLLRARYLAANQEINYPDDPDAFQLIGAQDGVWLYKRPEAFPAAWLVHDIEIQEDEAQLLARLNDATFDPKHTALLAQQPTTCELGQDNTQDNTVDNVNIIRWRNNQLDFQVQTSTGALLVLSEVMYPGWHVSLNDKSAQILRANHILRAVCVPPGEHQVSFRFIPTTLLIGAGGTLLTCLLIIWAGWAQWQYLRAQDIKTENRKIGS